jgi:hypothetical protein
MFQTQYQEGVAERNKEQGGFLGFVDKVLPAVALGIVTGGVGSALASTLGISGSLATGIGTSLGIEGAGAATVGNAVLSAGMNALTSVVTGKDITAEGLLTSAVVGGVGANSMDIAANIVGGGDAIAGIETLSKIADEMGVKVAEVGKIVSGAVANGISSAIQGGDIIESVTNNLVSSGLGAYAGGLVNSIDPGNLDTAVKVATGVAKVGATTAMNGGDITTAIQNSLPSILTNSLTVSKDADINKADTQKAEIDALDPMGQYLANYLTNPDAPDPLGLNIYPRGLVAGEGTGIVDPNTTNRLPDTTPTIDITGVGSFFDPITGEFIPAVEKETNALFSFGDPDLNAKYQAMFGSGSTGSATDLFTLFANGTSEQKNKILDFKRLTKFIFC